MKLPDKLSRIIHELVPLQIPVYSGNASFFLLLSFFPLAILLLALLQYLPVTQTDLLSLIELIVPQALLPFFSDNYRILRWQQAPSEININILRIIYENILALINSFFDLQA